MPKLNTNPVNLDVRKMPEKRTEVRLGFVRRGESIGKWAIARGYSPNMVQAVLSGGLACNRGISHQIAVDLGLKPDPSTTAGE